MANIVESLELRQPTVVTNRLLAEVAAETGSRLGPGAVAERLVRGGWLLPLRRRGAWEFVPGARAGRFSSGDPWLELRAVLAQDPAAPVAVAFESAVWELGFSDHQPAAAILAHRHGWRPPRALDGLRSVTYDWRLAAGDKAGLPLWHPATVVVAAAHRPDIQGDWANADDWLPETMRATTPDEVLVEADGRPTATLARLGYLAEWSGRSDIAEAVAARLRAPWGVTFLGPRDRRRRWAKRWRVYDSVLPDP